jgi:hypothetical protein
MKLAIPQTEIPEPSSSLFVGCSVEMKETECSFVEKYMRSRC